MIVELDEWELDYLEKVLLFRAEQLLNSMRNVDYKHYVIVTKLQDAMNKMREKPYESEVTDQTPNHSPKKAMK
jgi:hypothetical protein